MLVAPSTAGKDGCQPAADLKAGDWADVKVTLTGARAGQTAGFYVEGDRDRPGPLEVPGLLHLDRSV